MQRVILGGGSVVVAMPAAAESRRSSSSLRCGQRSTGTVVSSSSSDPRKITPRTCSHRSRRVFRQVVGSSETSRKSATRSHALKVHANARTGRARRTSARPAACSGTRVVLSATRTRTASSWPDSRSIGAPGFLIHKDRFAGPARRRSTANTARHSARVRSNTSTAPRRKTSGRSHRIRVVSSPGTPRADLITTASRTAKRGTVGGDCLSSRRSSPWRPVSTKRADRRTRRVDSRVPPRPRKSNRCLSSDWRVAREGWGADFFSSQYCGDPFEQRNCEPDDFHFLWNIATPPMVTVTEL